MVDENKFKNVNFNKSNQEKKFSNVNSSKIDEYISNLRQEAQSAMNTGNTKGLEDLANESAFNSTFKDERSVFQKIKDTTLSYVASMKHQEHLIKSGKYQAIEKQMKVLSSHQDTINSHRETIESAKSLEIKNLSKYEVDLDIRVEELAQLEAKFSDLRSAFSDDAISLLSDYFSGKRDVDELAEYGLKTDLESLSGYRKGLADVEVKGQELQRKKMSVNALHTEYELSLDKKSQIEIDLIDLDLQDFYTTALINQLSVELKLSSRPSIASLFASLRTKRDQAHELTNSLLEDDISKRTAYNDASKIAGYDSGFRKSYTRNQKKRPGFKL